MKMFCKFLSLSILLIGFLSCQKSFQPKNIELSTLTRQEKIEYFARSFIMDKDFSNVVKAALAGNIRKKTFDQVRPILITNNIKKVTSGILSSSVSSKKNDEDGPVGRQSIEQEILEEFYTSYVIVLENNQEYANLDMHAQLSVIDMVAQLVSDPNFVQDHPTSPLVGVMQQIINQPIEIGSNGLTWGEVTSCAFGAIGGTIAGSWGLIRQVYEVIHGYNLGWGGILNVVKSTMKTMIGGNAAALVIEFGFCLIGASW